MLSNITKRATKSTSRSGRISLRSFGGEDLKLKKEVFDIINFANFFSDSCKYCVDMYSCQVINVIYPFDEFETNSLGQVHGNMVLY